MKKAYALALVALVSTQVQAAEKEVQAFMTYEKFIQLPEAYRQFYVAGMADAFTYLEAKTGRMKGLGECLRTNNVTPRVAEELVSEILRTNPRSRGNTLAEAFELGNQAACSTYITDDVQKKALEY